MSVSYPCQMIDLFRARSSRFFRSWIFPAYMLVFSVLAYRFITINFGSEGLLKTLAIYVLGILIIFIVSILVSSWFMAFRALRKEKDYISTFTMTDTGIIDDTAGRKVECHYYQIRSVRNDKNNFYMRVSDSLMVVLPFRAFETQDEIRGFVDLMTHNIGNKKVKVKGLFED